MADAALEKARVVLAALRKTEVSALRQCTERDPVVPLAISALLVLGAHPDVQWTTARTMLCDPQLIKKCRGLSDVTVITPEAMQRLTRLLRRRALVPSEQVGGQAANALAEWAAAVVGAGLVRSKGTAGKRSTSRKEQNTLPEPLRSEPTPQVSAANSCAEEPPTSEVPVEQPEAVEAAAPAAPPPEGSGGAEESPTPADAVPPDDPPAAAPSSPPRPHTSVSRSPERERPDVVALRCQVTALERELSERARELTSLRRSLSPSAPISPTLAGSGHLSPTLQAQGAQTRSPTGPRAEPQPITAEQTRALAQNAWRGLCRMARKDMAEHELARVSQQTLHLLLSRYGYDSRPVEFARVELHWLCLNGKPPAIYRPMPAAPTPALVNPPGSNPRESLGIFRPSQSPSSPPPRRVGSLSPGTSVVRAASSRDRARGHCPETAGRQRKFVEASRSLSPLNGGGVMEWTPPSPECRAGNPDSEGAYANPNTVGARHAAPEQRRYAAQTGKADPNTLASERDKFAGVETAPLHRLQEAELKAIVTCGEGTTLGGKSSRRPLEVACRSDPNAVAEGDIEKEGRRRVLPHPAVPPGCDPNVLSPTEGPPSSRKGNANPDRHVSSGCNPNTVGVRGGSQVITGHVSPRNRTGGPTTQQVFSPQTKGGLKNVQLAALSDPSTAGLVKTTPRTGRGSAGGGGHAALCDPNEIRGDEAVARHVIAQQRDKAAGDQVFGGSRQPHAPESRVHADPNSAGNADRLHGPSRKGGVDAPPTKMQGGGAPLPVSTADNMLGPRRGRVQQPGQRFGKAADPIHGVDGRLASPRGDGRSGATLGHGIRGTGGRQRVQGQAVMADIIGEIQPRSPRASPSRKRQVASINNL